MDLKCIHGTTDWKGLSERVEDGLNMTVIKEDDRILKWFSLRKQLKFVPYIARLQFQFGERLKFSKQNNVEILRLRTTMILK